MPSSRQLPGSLARIYRSLVVISASTHDCTLSNRATPGVPGAVCSLWRRAIVMHRPLVRRALIPAKLSFQGYHSSPECSAPAADGPPVPCGFISVGVIIHRERHLPLATHKPKCGYPWCAIAALLASHYCRQLTPRRPSLLLTRRKSGPMPAVCRSCFPEDSRTLRHLFSAISDFPR